MKEQATDILGQFARVTDYWSPKIVTRVGDMYLKVARLKGQLAWHSHEGEDELFWVLRGTLTIELEDGAVRLSAGECYVVPKGVRHNPVAEEECWIALIEPVSTQHTGDVLMEQTRSIEEQLS